MKLKDKSVVFWPYKYNFIRNTNWESAAHHISSVLQRLGYTIYVHKNYDIKLANSFEYEGQRDCDIVIYNHTVKPHIVGDIINANHTWIFKSTIPDLYHFTIDTLGYSGYSEPTYSKPPYNNISQKAVDDFFSLKVSKWIENKSTKWGTFNNNFSLLADNYILLLLQIPYDVTVNDMWFGDYYNSIDKIILELLRAQNRPIVIKFHPYLDGDQKALLKLKDKRPREAYLYKRITSLISKSDKSNLIHICRGDVSVHDLIPNCYCAITCNSGSGFDVMMHHKPIISYGYPEYHWITYDLRHLCDLTNALSLSWFSKEESDKYLCWYLTEYACCDYNSTVRRVNNLLLK